jgi:hypothetical protein
MARFYADEQFPFPVVELLRTLGHDVLTVQEAGKTEKRYFKHRNHTFFLAFF